MFIARLRDWVCCISSCCDSNYFNGSVRTSRNRFVTSVPAMVEDLESRRLLTASTGTWTPLASTISAGTMMLLTDGTVIVQGTGALDSFSKLSPDNAGNYVNSTSSVIASMGTPRLYVGSNVLPDGRVLVIGGEYSGSPLKQNWVNTGEIYDPVADKWKAIANFPQTQFGDDPTVLLPSGKILAGYLSGGQTYLYDPATDVWTATGSKLRGDASDEETWSLLPDGSVLSYDVFASSPTGTGHAQRYIPSTGTWVDAGVVPVPLTGSKYGYEFGPQTLLPNGNVFSVGANNNTVIYSPSTNTWAAGPKLPVGMGADDAPGVMLANGHFLFAADMTQPQIFSSPTKLFDYDYTTNSLADVTPGGVLGASLANGPAFVLRMLSLPNGHVLLGGAGSGQIWDYAPNGAPQPEWRPTISGIVQTSSTSYVLSGTQLTGISEGASYGDDAEMSTNYPIVRVTNTLTGKVTYARTTGWTPGVATGNKVVTVNFDLPSDFATGGNFSVVVVANGLSSLPGQLRDAAPSGTSSTVTLVKDTTLNIQTSNFGFIDPVNIPSNALKAVEITTLPAVGTLTDRGVAVTQGQFVSAIDISGGKLVYTPALHTFGQNYGNFNFHVQDDGGTANGGFDIDPAAKTLRIDVIPEIPSVTATIVGGAYRGTAYAVTNARAFDVNNKILAVFGDATLSYSYYSGKLTADQALITRPLPGAPRDAGTYTAVAKFTSNLAQYSNAYSAPLYFTISPAPLVISALSDRKIYDGSTSTVKTPTITGLKGTDTVTDLIQVFDSKDVLGTNGSLLRVIQYTINGGNDGNDYTITVKTASGTITPYLLTVFASPNTKTFDGTTSADAIPVASGLYGTDSVTGLTESYASVNVLGASKSVLTVNAGYTIDDGNGGRDYTITKKSIAGTITPAPITISAAANWKVYDGTTSATAIPFAGAMYGNDSVTGLHESYVSKAVLGPDKSTLTVNAGFTVVDGNNGKNYVVTLNPASGTIAAAAAKSLVFLQAPPTSGIAGVAIAPTVSVAIEDIFGNIVDTDQSVVTLVIGTASITATAINGIATFNTSKFVIKVAGNYAISATDSALKPATGSINIAPAAASKLVFTTVPGTGSLAKGLAASVIVAIEDAFGNIVTGNTSSVTLSLVSRPAGSDFATGTVVTVNAVNGIATFSNLKFTKVGSYTLKAVGSSLSSAVSTSVVIS